MRRHVRWPVLVFLQLVGLVLIQVALFVVFAHEHRQDQVTMFQKQLLHRSAMIEELLDDSQDLIPVLEVGREPVDVDEDVDDWYVGQDVKLAWLKCGIKVWNFAEQELGLLVHIKVQLAENHFVELLEDAILSQILILLMLVLDNLVHTIQVLLQLDLVDDEVGVALLVKLLVLPRHVQIFDLVIEEEACGGLLEADHVLGQSLASRAVEVLGEVLSRVGDVCNRALAEESEVHIVFCCCYLIAMELLLMSL